MTTADQLMKLANDLGSVVKRFGPQRIQASHWRARCQNDGNADHRWAEGDRIVVDVTREGDLQIRLPVETDERGRMVQVTLPHEALMHYLPKCHEKAIRERDDEVVRLQRQLRLARKQRRPL